VPINNPTVYNAVLSGVFAGINTSRTLRSTTAADYATQRDAAVAFAALVDSLITAGTFSAADGQLLQGLVQQCVSGKGSINATSAVALALIAAFNELRPALVATSGADSVLNNDGSAPLSRTILPAGHAAGTYLWTLYFQKTTASNAGNLVAQMNYTDEGGAAVLLRPNASLVSAGHFNLAPFPIYSTGVNAITVDMTFPGIGTAPVMNLYNVLTPLSQAR
jgi:hypothetical protein